MLVPGTARDSRVPSVDSRCLRDSDWESRPNLAVSGTVSRYARIAAVVLLACLQSAGVALAQDEALRRLYSSAQSAEAQGDLRRAADNYEQIIRLLPDMAEAHANLGSIYYRLGEDSSAAKSLERATELKPGLAAPHFFLGMIAGRGQDYESASRHLEACSRLDPTNPIVPIYLGEAYFATGRHLVAAAEFWKASQSSEYRADAYYFLNRAYTKLAEGSLEHLAAEHPNSFFLKLSLGRFHEGREDWRQAERAYLAAQAIRPEAEGLADRLEWIGYMRHGGPSAVARPPLPEARPSLLGLLYDPPAGRAIEPLLQASRRRLAGSMKVGSGPEAIYRRAQEYQVASYLTARWIAENDLGSYRAHQLRAQLHEARGEIDEAVSAYRAALLAKPDLREVHFAIGSLLWSVSRLDEALPELRAELKVNPNHPEAHFEIADILVNFGRSDEARVHLSEAIRVAPEMAEAHLAIERIYFAQGRFAEGLRHLKQAAQLDPADPTPHYRMASVYRRLGKPEESARALAEFQRLQPD